MSKAVIPQFAPAIDRRLDLPALRNWRPERHVFKPHTRAAIQAALACQRPLLLLGEPGLGKTQLARAAAEVLGWPLVYQVVNGRTECEDLLYRFDAVARLARAQVAGRTHIATSNPSPTGDELDPLNYVVPGVLWWAYAWTAAADQSKRASGFCGEAVDAWRKPDDWQQDSRQGVVVLIDEIDKADSEVPNSLLEGLGTVGFQVPHGGGFVSLPHGYVPPLVIVTSNEERDLPPAFLRRCCILRLELPEGELELKQEILSYAEVHFDATDVPLDVREAVFDQWLKDRRSASGDDPRAGLAEYLDMLRALHEMHPGDGKKQRDLFEETHPYILGKHKQRLGA